MAINQLFDGLPIFVQVVKSAGFSAAAEALGHSSSHISKEISKLESRLGVRLLNRTTRTIALTPEGEAFYRQCIQLVADAESAVELVTQNDALPKGELKISCPIGLAHSHLQAVLTEYLTLYPNVTLDLDLSDKHIDLIADGYDLVVRATQSLSESTLICRQIFSAPAYVVASKSYIEKHGRPHHPRELSQHHCICYSNLKQPERWEFTDHGGKTLSVNVRQRIKCNNGVMEMAMVRNGLGICRLPSFYMDEAFANDELEVLFPDWPCPAVNIYALYPSRKHLSPKVRRFIDLLAVRLSVVPD
ncbi:LysR family transcriptional regulator (plasmid) [Photobacterium sp. GJ3]|uniref:LysR family transcriptional regulator n=1 Tax=Photobacterium sp. GJ3 TaxID=2829502 RepID=UPI001B8C8DBF|nr:LysR family transcriptional regulator [Photobacterium sp. GJ3]QUJ69695.1 LysR family transcriptional regulator [Photobacterium sp. GJ3]